MQPSCRLTRARRRKRRRRPRANSVTVESRERSSVWEEAFSQHFAPTPLQDAEPPMSLITQTQRLTSPQEEANATVMAAAAGPVAAPAKAVTYVLSPDQVVPASHYRPYEQNWP